MALPAIEDIGGKSWRDLGGATETFKQDNLNRMRPQGFIHVPLPVTNPFDLEVLPVTWVNGTSLDDYAGDALVTQAPSSSLFYWLDGADPPATQLKSGASLPAFGSLTDPIYVLAFVVTNGSGVVSIKQIGRAVDTPGAGGGVNSVTANAPLVQSGTAADPVIDLPNAVASGASGALTGADKQKLDDLGSASDVLKGSQFDDPGELIQGANPGPGASFLTPAGAADARKIIRLNSAGLQWVIEEFLPFEEIQLLTLTAVSTAKDDGGVDLEKNGSPYSAFELSLAFTQGSNVIAGSANHILRINTAGVYLFLLVTALTDGANFITARGLIPADTPSTSPGEFCILDHAPASGVGGSHIGTMFDIQPIASAPTDLAFEVSSIAGGFPQGNIDVAKQNLILAVKIKD